MGQLQSSLPSCVCVRSIPNPLCSAKLRDMKKLILIVGLLLSPALFPQNVVQQTSITTQSEVTTSTTSTEALAANPKRRYLRVVNKGAETVYLKFGSASTGTIGLPLATTVTYEPSVVPTDAIFLKAASNTPVVLVIEGM